MASQRRRSTALFEVIHHNQRSGIKGALRTPKWWFKSKLSGASAAATQSDHPSDSAPAVASTAAASEVAPRAGRSLGRSAVHFDFDRDRHELAVRMRYTTAIVSAFAVLVAIGLAYTVGRHIAGGPSPAYAAASTDELLRLPANPSAMDLRGQTPASTNTSHLPQLIATSNGTANPAPPPEAPKNGVDTNPTRSVGLNYIIVQSFNTEKLADEARDFLVAHGVPCTVEKISNFFTVISSTGYVHIHSPEFENAIKNITALGEQFGGKTSKFKRFDPYGYKWKATVAS
jgi:hypothetical protein